MHLQNLQNSFQHLQHLDIEDIHPIHQWSSHNLLKIYSEKSEWLKNPSIT